MLSQNAPLNKHMIKRKGTDKFKFIFLKKTWDKNYQASYPVRIIVQDRTLITYIIHCTHHLSSCWLRAYSKRWKSAASRYTLF